MDIQTCTQCGALIEGEGIRHRKQLFCGDECCEEFEDQFLVRGGPDEGDLDEADDELDDDLAEDELFDDDDEDFDDDDVVVPDDDY